VDDAAGWPANQGRAPVRERILDARGQAQDGDARNIINARRAGNTKARVAAGYHPQQGGRYDSHEDRSPTPEPPGTRVFSREIRTASFPQHFRQPTSIDKYTGETDPRVWLNAYHLAVCGLCIVGPLRKVLGGYTHLLITIDKFSK
jgi:hypothetical protein